MPSDTQPGVETPSVGYARMEPLWSLVRDLSGGTESMRAAGKKWLPKEVEEKDTQYNRRLERSFLFNAFDDAIGRIIERPFSKQVTVENAPDGLEILEEDCDGLGTHIHDFTAEVMDDAVRYGLTHILIDFPALPSERTLEDERLAGARPTLSHIHATSLIGWKYENPPEGMVGLPVLSQVRISQVRTEQSGDYGDIEVEYIKVIGRSTWDLHRKMKVEGVEKFVLVESGEHTFGEVPLVTIYAQKTGTMTAEPPLKNLAWLNIAHWQSESDQRNILRFARLAPLVITGVPKDEDGDG